MIKYIAFILLVFIIIPFLALKAYEAWNKPLKIKGEKIFLNKQERKAEKIFSPKKTANEPIIPIQSYIFISEKNIFSPERKEFPIITGLIKSPAEIKKHSPRPQIVLYGITIHENYQAATIQNPKKPLQKGEREMLTYRLGDQIGEYKLTKIMPDRIVLETSEDSFEVLLYDPKVSKRRQDIRTDVKPATITTATTTPMPQPSAPAPLTVPGSETLKPVPPKEIEKPKDIQQERVMPQIQTPRSVNVLPSSPLGKRERNIMRPQSPRVSPQEIGSQDGGM